VLIREENRIGIALLENRAAGSVERAGKVGDVRALRTAVRDALDRVENGECGVEVVETGVGEVERDDFATEDLSDLAVAVAGRAEASAGKDRVTDEKEVTLALIDLFRLDGVKTVLAEPIRERGGLACPLGAQELRNEGTAVAHNAAVGGVDHIGETLKRVDELDLMPELQIEVVQLLPLRHSLRGVSGFGRLHPRIDGVADREVLWAAHQVSTVLCSALRGLCARRSVRDCGDGFWRRHGCSS